MDENQQLLTNASLFGNAKEGIVVIRDLLQKTGYTDDIMDVFGNFAERGLWEVIEEYTFHPEVVPSGIEHVINRVCQSWKQDCIRFTNVWNYLKTIEILVNIDQCKPYRYVSVNAIRATLQYLDASWIYRDQILINRLDNLSVKLIIQDIVMKNGQKKFAQQYVLFYKTYCDEVQKRLYTIKICLGFHLPEEFYKRMNIQVWK